MLGNIALVLLVVVAVKSDEECNRQAIQNCDEEGIFIEGPEPIPGFPDEAYLNKYCRPAIQMAECVRDLVRKCPDIEIADKLPVLELFVPFLHSVCDEDSEIKKGYLANVNCYNGSLPQMEQCTNRVGNLVENFFEKVQDETEFRDAYIDQFCILEPLLVSCVVKTSTTSCGAEATIPLANVLNQLTRIIKVAACPEDILLRFQSRLVTYIDEVGFELKKKRRRK